MRQLKLSEAGVPQESNAPKVRAPGEIAFPLVEWAKLKPSVKVRLIQTGPGGDVNRRHSRSASGNGDPDPQVLPYR